MHQGKNLVPTVVFVIITKKRSTSFDHKTKGAWLIKKNPSHKDQTRITLFGNQIKWTEFQFLFHVSLRNRHLWNTELLIYIHEVSRVYAQTDFHFPRFEATKSQNQTNKTKQATENPFELKNRRHQQHLYLSVVVWEYTYSVRIFIAAFELSQMTDSTTTKNQSVLSLIQITCAPTYSTQVSQFRF